MSDEHDAVMEFNLEFSFLESGSDIPLNGKAKARFSKEEISVLPEAGDALVLQYRELSEISYENPDITH